MSRLERFMIEDPTAWAWISLFSIQAGMLLASVVLLVCFYARRRARRSTP